MIGYPIVTENNQRVSDALQWFRDEKGIQCAVNLVGSTAVFVDGYYGVIRKNKSTDFYPAFPEAESALLEALIKYEEEKK